MSEVAFVLYERIGSCWGWLGVSVKASCEDGGLTVHHDQAQFSRRSDMLDRGLRVRVAATRRRSGVTSHDGSCLTLDAAKAHSAQIGHILFPGREVTKSEI